MLVGLGVFVVVGSEVRLGGCVWVEVETCVDVTVADGIGLEGAPAQPTAATERSANSAAFIKRARPGRRSVKYREVMRTTFPLSNSPLLGVVPELNQVRALQIL